MIHQKREHNGKVTDEEKKNINRPLNSLKCRSWIYKSCDHRQPIFMIIRQFRHFNIWSPMLHCCLLLLVFCSFLGVDAQNWLNAWWVPVRNTYKWSVTKWNPVFWYWLFGMRASWCTKRSLFRNSCFMWSHYWILFSNLCCRFIFPHWFSVRLSEVKGNMSNKNYVAKISQGSLELIEVVQLNL